MPLWTIEALLSMIETGLPPWSTFDVRLCTSTASCVAYLPFTSCGDDPVEEGQRLGESK